MSRGELLLIHGMWCTPKVWDGFAETLQSSGWKPSTPALPQHGPDADLEALGKLGIEDYLIALEAAVDALDEAPFVIGHSLGGLLALLLATRRPVRGLALLAPACPAGILSIRPSVLRGLLGPMLRWSWWGKPLSMSRENSRWALMAELHPERQEQILDGLVAESGRVVFQVGLWMLDRARTTRLTGCNTPVKIWVGDRDRVCPPGPIGNLATRIGAPYKLLPGRSHWLQEEDGWEDLAAEIDAWGAELALPN